MKVPEAFAVELYATCRGSGPPVVLIHGLLGSGRSWQNIAQRLAPYLTVYCVDLRNHGKSPHDDAFNYAVMAADLKAFLQRRRLSKAALIGHSMGGKVAMQLACASPESVASLVVLDMAPKPYGTENRSILKCLLGMDLSGCDRQKQVFEKMSELIPDDSLCNLMITNLVRDAGGGYRWKINLRAIYDNFDGICMDSGVTVVSDLPALFIRAEHAEYINDRDADRIVRFFPKASLATITGASHWLHIDAPDRLSRMLLNFIIPRSGHSAIAI